MWKRAGPAVLLTAVSVSAQEAPYWPGPWGDWEKRALAEAGMDAGRLEKAIAFAEEHFARDGGFDPSREPSGDRIGPVKPPSGMNGLVVVGGHWGGGMFINSRDQARFGLLMLRGGTWRNRRLLSADWIERARTPTPQNTTYGYMNWFLNTGERRTFPAAPAGNVFFLGAGTNMVWLDPSHDLVAVVRWLERREVNAFIEKILAAFEGS